MDLDYRIISADSHLELAPERWVSHIVPEWADRAPRTVKLRNGRDAVVMENRPIHRLNYAMVGGAPRDQWRNQWRETVPTFANALGGGPPEQRLDEQDRDGIGAEVLFAHPAHLNMWRGIDEDEGFAALIHAYNQFLIEDYARVAPDRLLTMGVIPPTRLDDAMGELEYCAQAGFKGIALYGFPSGNGYPTSDDDRFWRRCMQLDMPVSVHTKSGTTRFLRDASPPLPKSKGGDPNRRDHDIDLADQLLRFASDAPYAVLQLIVHGVFDRFPALKIYCAETQVGWLPQTCSQLDANYQRYAEQLHELQGLEYLRRRPSEYLHDHTLWGFVDDFFGVGARRQIGVETIMWGSDFPHGASDWPYSRKLIDDMFAESDEQERYSMVAGNAIGFFRL